MLSNIEINNFKLFENFKVNSFKRINIFVGETNSGKTALLETIFSLLADLSQEHFLGLLRNYPIHIPLNKELWDLVIKGKEATIKGFWEGQEVMLKVSHIKEPTKDLLNRLPPSADLESGIELERTYQSEKENLVLCFDRRFLHNFSEQFPKFSTSPLIPLYSFEGNKNFHVPLFFHRSDGKISLESIRKLIGKLIKEDLKINLLKLVRIFEPNIEDINNIPFADFETPAIKIKEGNYLPLNSMGDGFYKAFCFGCLILNYRNGIVLIDEVENGIYYAFQGELWKWLLESSKRFNVQLFITTHSREFIENALRNSEKELLNEIALYRLSKEQSFPTIISGDELLELIEYGYEYR
jgi:AAA15 family ATPase/GTPase